MNAIAKPRLTHLDAGCNGTIMPAEEFDAIEEWDSACKDELIRGVVIVNPVPTEGEADPNCELGMLLRACQVLNPQGAALEKTLQGRYVCLPDGSRRKADRWIWDGLGRPPHPQRDVPAMIVNFVSERGRDRRRDDEEKKQEYLSLGVKEYRLIDRFQRFMTFFRADGSVQKIAENDTFTTPLPPGFELPLARLIALSDEWEKDDET
jgi:Uma2 family endonuclease